MALNEGACPSRFPWHSPRKRLPLTVRTMSTTHNKMQGLEESLSEDQEMDEEPASLHKFSQMLRESCLS